MIQYLVPLFFADPAMGKGKGGMLKEKALRQKKKQWRLALQHYLCPFCNWKTLRHYSHQIHSVWASVAQTSCSRPLFLWLSEPWQERERKKERKRLLGKNKP